MFVYLLPSTDSDARRPDQSARSDPARSASSAKAQPTPGLVLLFYYYWFMSRGRRKARSRARAKQPADLSDDHVLYMCVCIYIYIYTYIYIYMYIHPVSVTRFPSFRTQTLENLSVDSVKWVPGQPSPWRKILWVGILLWRPGVVEAGSSKQNDVEGYRCLQNKHPLQQKHTPRLSTPFPQRLTLTNEHFEWIGVQNKHPIS